MAVDNYNDLKSYLVSRLARTDYLDAQAAEDVALSEKFINRRLRVKQNSDLSNTLDTVANTRDYILPSDFLSMIAIGYTDNKFLRETSLQNIKDRVNSQVVGKPELYAITNTTISFDPVPDTAYPITYAYRAKIPALSDINTTNWLLDLYPDIYIDTGLYFAFKRFRDPRAIDMKADSISAIEEANLIDRDDDLASGNFVMRSQVCE